MDLTILTFKNGVEKYWPVKSPELPEDVIAFKYLKEVSAEYDDYLITNYRIGVPIDKPMTYAEWFKIQKQKYPWMENLIDGSSDV